MNSILFWYLIGAIISLIIQVIAALVSERIRVSNVIGYILNTALSWGCIATFGCQMLISLLNRLHWNKILYESKEAKEQRQKEQKTNVKKLH